MITNDEFSRLSHYDQGDYINEIFKQNGLDEPLEWDIHGYWVERKTNLVFTIKTYVSKFNNVLQGGLFSD